MAKLVTALLVKDEKDKYLERVLRRCREFSDVVLVLDDNSTDGSRTLARQLGCRVRKRKGEAMWGKEYAARSELWNWGAEVAEDGWLLICDADMLLHGDPRPLTWSTSVNCWAWVLYDVWGSEKYARVDGYWQGHVHPRPWMFRPSCLGYDQPAWNARGLHVGHCPHNAQLQPGIADIQSLYWIHLAYRDSSHRLQKRDRYLAQAHQLSPFERAHAESVGD